MSHCSKKISFDLVIEIVFGKKITRRSQLKISWSQRAPHRDIASNIYIDIEKTQTQKSLKRECITTLLIMKKVAIGLA